MKKFLCIILWIAAFVASAYFWPRVSTYFDVGGNEKKVELLERKCDSLEFIISILEIDVHAYSRLTDSLQLRIVDNQKNQTILKFDYEKDIDRVTHLSDSSAVLFFSEYIGRFKE